MAATTGTVRNDSNRVRERLSRGQEVMGTWSIVPSAAMSEIAASSGLDFLILDLEHGAFGLETLHSCILACESFGCSPLVRVPEVGSPLVQNVLDLGAHGVVFPQIKSVEEAVGAVKSCRLPPDGTRGFNPFTRSGTFLGKSSGSGAARLENGFPISCVLLETPGAVRDLDLILKIPGLDLVYLGVYDMSLALGCGGDVRHPKVQAFVEEATRKITTAGIVVGAMFKTKEELGVLRGLGVKFLVYGVDAWAYRGAFESVVTMARGKGRG